MWDRAQAFLLEELDDGLDGDTGMPGSLLATVVLAQRHVTGCASLVEGLTPRRSDRALLVEDGAAAVAAVTAHQPDLLVTGSSLPGWNAVDLLPTASRTSPRTLRAVVGAERSDVAALLEAGAHALVGRSVPHADAAARLLDLLRRPRAEPLVLL